MLYRSVKAGWIGRWHVRAGRLIHGAVMLLAVLVLLVAPACVSAAANSSSLELLGGSGTRAISLAPVVVRSPASAAHRFVVLRAAVHLAVRNLTAKRLPVRVIYTAQGASTVHVAARATIGRDRVGELTVSFEVPASASPDSLDGTLDVETGGRAPTEQFSVPVSGQLQQFGDVRFSPATGVVRVTRGCVVFACNTSNGGVIRIIGGGVGHLLAYLKAAGVMSLHGRLYRGSNFIDATLGHLRADPTEPGTATASLTFDSKPGPCVYKGTVAVSTLVAGAPALNVEVHSRYWFPWAILAIFVGVLLAGLVYQQLGLWQRKRLLKGALTDVVDKDYGPNRADNDVPAPDGNLIQRLNIDCPLELNRDWNYWDDLDSAKNIYTAIVWARNDADLDEAQTAALSLIRDVKSWLLALTAVRGLWELARSPREQPNDWRRTNVFRDSELLLIRARRTPGNALLSSNLMPLVEQQTAWHRAFAQAWDLRSELLQAGGDAATEAGSIDLVGLDQHATPVATRTSDDQNALDLGLTELFQNLVDIRRRHAPQLPIPIVSTAREQETAERRAQLDAFESSARPDLALANFRVAAITALAPVTLAVGDITDDAAPARGENEDHAPDHPPVPLVSQRNAANVAQPQPADPAGVRARLARAARRSNTLKVIRLLDLLVSVAVLLVTSILYAATIYGDAWGTVGDFGTAFGAGFLGQVTIKWAVLPIYRSIRLRPIATQSTDGAANSSGG